MALKLDVVPDKAVVVRRDKSIVAASWFGPWVRRPYIYPFLAPGDREITRLGHPEDPVGHSHHKSIWVGHHDVAGVDFWGESPQSGRIVQKEVKVDKDPAERVEALLHCSWQTVSGQEVLQERRRLTFIDMPRAELALELEIELRAPGEPVVLGKTNFGLLGIRVARTLRVHEGLGGLIFNSDEAENESGCFGQHAVWCDYSGPVPLAAEKAAAREQDQELELPAAVVGIACFDHPGNAPEETLWHVRDDGWMGPSLTRRTTRTVEKDKPLRVRYRLEAHAGRPWDALVDQRYRLWRRLAHGKR